MKKLLKAICKLAGVAFGLFAVTFAVYFFNLDMKLTAFLEPYIKELQEKAERDQHL